jgi:NADH-quinone oxidoreductase subunit C
MNENLSAVVSAIQARFAAQTSEFRGEITLLVAPDQIVETCRALRDEFGFDMLVDETAVDYFDADPRFHVVYHLLRMKDQAMLVLRVPLSGNAPSLPTIESIYLNANWYEREVWDLFGIRYEGHSDPRRIMMPEDWEGHPLRKDYPLGYEEVQFTFNVSDIDQRKPYAKE